MRTTILSVVAVGLLVASPAMAQCTEIWIDQAIGVNDPGTQGTPEDPFKSITYALAIAENQGWSEPWCVNVRPGVYDADPDKPVTEREIFPIVLGPEMVFEGTDRDTCIIDGQHYSAGDAALLYGNDLIDLQIRGLTLRNMSHTSGGGGAIQLIECSGRLEECTIENCSARNGGGMSLGSRAASDEGFNFVSCTFSNNTATASGGTGGGLNIYSGFTGTIDGCTFADNNADGRGGGFNVWGSVTGNMTGCTLTGNVAGGDSGAGFAIDKNWSGDIRECSFESNSIPGSYLAWRYGGGFCVHGSMTGDIVECSFTGNSLVNRAYWSVEGGGFCVKNALNGTVIDCTFVRNWAESIGGGFRVGTLNGGVSGCTFTGNWTLENDGAGFYVGTLSDGVVDCTFAGNSAEGYGGGFFCNGYFGGGVSNCEFDENVAGYDGGGFKANGNLGGDIVGCTFTDNKGWRGGFSVIGTLTGDIRKCMFVSSETALANSALRIGGVLDGALEQCTFFGFPYDDVRLVNGSGLDTLGVVHNCLFVDTTNPVADSCWGIETSQNTLISNNTMIGPGLGLGISPAALYFASGTQEENSEVYNNIIVQTECAIRVAPMVDMTIRYNQFDDVDCIVVQGDSCLGNNIDYLELLLDNFRFNDYGDPGFVAWPTGTWTAPADYEYEPETGQTTFFDDAATWSPGALVGLILYPDTAYDVRALIAANTATTVSVWGDYEAYGTTGNTYEIGDHHLAGGSPCIDAGDNAAVPADVSDLDGDGDTTEPTPFDLDGRLRFADRIGTSDTGNPDPDHPDLPIVDMGAYEYQCTGDLDGDGDVDGNDFLTFSLCYNGSLKAPQSGCANLGADIDEDGDVDGFDFTTWAMCHNGSLKPPQSGCCPTN